MIINFELGDKRYKIELPEETTVLSMNGAANVSNPSEVIKESLSNPIGCESYFELVKRKLKEDPQGEAVIVISDNTRPVPYRGEQGILLPLVKGLLSAGAVPEQITILCANGTHIPLEEDVFRKMLDPALFELGVKIVNHDCLDDENLKFLGYSKSGTKIEINKIYVDASIKILTGLVESHFMAGVSGGRKSICPGLIGEDSTFIFHGVENLDDAYSRDLVLMNNPCHEEALDVASTVGADFIFNVTLDHNLNVTGYFAGDMVEAHMAAYEKVKETVGIDISEKFDIVVAHAGFVGRNHYQAAKTGVAAIPALKKNGYLLLAADCIDPDPIGKETYKKVLPELKGRSSQDFIELLRSDKWDFVPDQWQVQMWSKLFSIIPQEHFIFYAPQISEANYNILPGCDGNEYLNDNERYQNDEKNIPLFLEQSLKAVIKNLRDEGKDEIRIAWLSDGPYGIVLPAQGGGSH